MLHTVVFQVKPTAKLLAVLAGKNDGLSGLDRVLLVTAEVGGRGGFSAIEAKEALLGMILAVARSWSKDTPVEGLFEDQAEVQEYWMIERLDVLLFTVPDLARAAGEELSVALNPEQAAFVNNQFKKEAISDAIIGELRREAETSIND